MLPVIAALLLATQAPAERTDGCPGVAVFFDSGAVTLTEAATMLIDQNMPWIRQMLDAGAWLNLTGNTDDVGSETANLVLSRRRAEAVRAYFLARGFRADQFRILPRGETRPLVDTSSVAPDDDSGRRQNRSVWLSPEMPVSVFRRFFPPGGAIC
jgi:outer membrane protein OmpA-like peptidoglycan-associated protein